MDSMVEGIQAYLEEASVVVDHNNDLHIDDDGDAYLYLYIVCPFCLCDHIAFGRRSHNQNNHLAHVCAFWCFSLLCQGLHFDQGRLLPSYF